VYGTDWSSVTDLREGVDMKRALLLSFALMLVAVVGFAQPTPVTGWVAMSPFPSDVSLCELPANLGLVNYYVIYVEGLVLEEFGWSGVTRLEFTAPRPSCMNNAAYLGEINQFPLVVGNTQTGYSVDFEGCQYATLICTIQYWIAGYITPCCEYPVFPGEAWSCSGVQVAPYARGGVVNADQNCRCVVPVQETTWGAVKALYSE